MSTKPLNFIVALISLTLLFSCQNETTTNNAAKTQQSKAPTEKSEKEKVHSEKIVLFFGNSLTAGYGLEEGQSFPSLIQNRIDSLGLDYKVVNAGLSGETTAGGKNRIGWVLKQPIDIFILELGGNDVLRGFDLKATEANLRSIIEQVREAKPETKIIIAGMLAPQNLGEAYTTTFASIYPKLAKEYNTGFIPFLLDGVAADPSLNQPDGIHPNQAGAKIVMENVWEVLENYL